jgi:hypothetical protein
MSVEASPLKRPILLRPGPGAAELDAVLSLSKEAKATVGFLSDSAFIERAIEGTLLAALIDGDLAGYLLYSLPRDEIRIVQLVVAKRFRGQRLARMLVDQLASDHPHRRGIVLTCRNDFDADSLWPRLDFIPLREFPGRNLDGKPLTRWFRSFGQPDLFSLLHEQDERPLAVMDACVFFEVAAPRPQDWALQLRADWLVDHARFGVADHLFVEIHKGEDPDERARETVAAQSMQLPSGSTNDWREFLDAFRQEHPDAPAKDLDDLTHAAQAIAGGATWLITTDRRFIARYGATALKIGGLRVVLVAEFLREIDEIARGDRYRPVDLAGTDVTRREVTREALSDLAGEFVNHSAGERTRDLRTTIELAAADPRGVRLELIEIDGARRGLLCWQESAASIDVLLARVVGGTAEPTLGRHLLAMARDEAISAQRETIRLLDEHTSTAVRASFRDEGFAAATDRTSVAVGHALRGHGTLAELHARVSELQSPLAGSALFEPHGDDLIERAAMLERWFAPFVVTDAGIPAFFIPIQHGWATDLIDIGLAEDQLLPRPWRLGLRRELVYYRSRRAIAGFTPPARLLWYVSGRSQGAGAIRAVSHMTDVIVGPHEHLFRRFRHFGVYRAGDVEDNADASGKVMAIRFTSTRRIYPVPLDDYRALLTGDPKSKHVVLRSVRPVDEHTFVSLLGLGVARAT